MFIGPSVRQEPTPFGGAELKSSLATQETSRSTERSRQGVDPRSINMSPLSG
ncbi:MAG: hypothetical protein QOH96_2419 [Blastocatellia bacterium]|nr:hypothetical protein [Blastocatellia bacterium]